MEKCVLIFRSAALGDFILAIPAIHEARKNYSQYKIIFLTIHTADKQHQKKIKHYVDSASKTPWMELVPNGVIDKTIVLSSVTDIKYLISVKRKLSSYDFEEAVLMLDPASPILGRLKKYILIKFLLGDVPIVGWRGSGGFSRNKKQSKAKGYLRHHVYGPLQFINEKENFTMPKDKDLRFDLCPNVEVLSWADKWFIDNELNRETTIALAPGSIQTHKRWPLENFIELAFKILDYSDKFHFLIIGAPQDKDLGARLEGRLKGSAISLCGESTIAQSGAILRKCNILIGNDGGAVHLGDAMGCSVISIIPGIEYPDSIEPWHNKQYSVRHKVACAPCYNFSECPEGHNSCMLELTVGEVYNKFLELIRQNQSF